jgi:uncharacterized spore protein YtfJ
MEDVERLVKATMGEIEGMLNTKRVIGDPIEVQGRTLIPLVSLGFGFGAGGGTGSGTGPRRGDNAPRGEGTGGGTGGGGGVRPIGVIVIDRDSVRIEGIRGATASVFEKMGETIGKVVERRAGERASGEQGGERGAGERRGSDRGGE